MIRIAVKLLAGLAATAVVLTMAGNIQNAKALASIGTLATVYVDDDGSDSLCNGLSAAISPDGDGNCAFATIGKGLSQALPDGTAKVYVGPGDYNYATSLSISIPVEIIGSGQGISNIIGSDFNNKLINIASNNVTIRNFTIEHDSDYPTIRIGNTYGNALIDNNHIKGPRVGVGLASASHDNTISNNLFTDSYFAVLIGGSYNNRIVDNTMTGLRNEAVRLTSSEYYGDERDYNDDNNYFEGNEISNSPEGIASYVEIDGLTIVANNFYNNTDVYSAIHLGVGTTNALIKFNKFSSNTCSVSLQGLSTPIDLSQNWWGSDSFPGIGEISCPPNGVYNNAGAEVTYVPFLTKEAYATLDPITEVISDLDQLGISGLITTDGDPTVANSATFEREVTLTVPTAGEESTIMFEEGTTITRTDGGTYNFGDLTASGVTTDNLSGFISGTVVNGAFQWGIPQIGLTFDPAITLNIFVGTNLNGQTLNIVRSVTGTDGWSNDGIVEPKTCVVTDGYCTFQATKASYYAATTRTVLPVSGGSGLTALMTRYFAQ